MKIGMLFLRRVLLKNQNQRLPQKNLRSMYLHLLLLHMLSLKNQRSMYLHLLQMVDLKNQLRLNLLLLLHLHLHLLQMLLLKNQRLLLLNLKLKLVKRKTRRKRSKKVRLRHQNQVLLKSPWRKQSFILLLQMMASGNRWNRMEAKVNTPLSKNQLRLRKRLL